MHLRLKLRLLTARPGTELDSCIVCVETPACVVAVRARPLDTQFPT